MYRLDSHNLSEVGFYSIDFLSSLLIPIDFSASIFFVQFHQYLRIFRLITQKMITIFKMGMYNGVFLFVCLFYLFIYFVLCLLPLKFYLLLKSWRYFELLEKKFKTHVVNLYSSEYQNSC